MGWNQEKVDEILLPVLKRMNARESQRQQKITQFLPSLPSTSSSSLSLTSPGTKQRRSIKSRRIRNVVARLTAGTIMNVCSVYVLIYKAQVHVQCRNSHSALFDLKCIPIYDRTVISYIPLKFIPLPHSSYSDLL